MIYNQSILKVIDNSGASKVKCLKILGGLKKKPVSEGDFLVISVYRLKKKNKDISKVLKGNVLKALLLRTKKKKRKKDGSFFNFTENSVCLLNNKKKLLATRVIGPLSRTVKKNSILKSLNLSTGFF